MNELILDGLGIVMSIGFAIFIAWFIYTTIKLLYTDLIKVRKQWPTLTEEQKITVLKKSNGNKTVAIFILSIILVFFVWQYNVVKKESDYLKRGYTIPSEGEYLNDALSGDGPYSTYGD